MNLATLDKTAPGGGGEGGGGGERGLGTLTLGARPEPGRSDDGKPQAKNPHANGRVGGSGVSQKICLADWQSDLNPGDKDCTESAVAMHVPVGGPAEGVAASG